MLKCGMLERDRLTLKRRSAVLCKQLVVDEMLVQLLQADDILTESMAESIMAEQTSQKRSWRLLLLLPKRGPKAFSHFCAALRETEQQHLRDLLTQSPEKDGKETHIEGLVDSSFPLPTQEGVAAKRPRTHESMEFSLDADSPINTPVLPCTPDFYLSHCQQGMMSCIENFCRRPEHRSVDSCVVCLLSHGVEGAVYGTDGQLMQLDWVFEAFDNSRCPMLQNKPKMFFIQACRGDEMDCGVEQIDGPARTCSPSCEQRDAGREGKGDADSIERGDMGRPRIKLPQRSDMICGFASLKGQRTSAMRNTKRGSWFIQELNAALRLQARDTHLADILVQVNRRIKEREGYAPGTAHHRCKEMSEFTSSLCKDLYLFPKYQP
ncbi:hypothetical protein F2P81_002039 [Scophthalmus maximus]|uniref:Caspase-2 n=1 Tax=Scophthalmus maximus TaxID=52904 RepID=A0A6A4TPN7_SCOMX|nr:hypothetical protein F2P81_002039 [Scophthalmus maximus]